MRQAIISIAFLVLLSACGGTKISNTSGQETKQTFQEMATKKLGTDVTYTMNDSKSYVLCVKEVKGTPQQPRNSISFVVIKLSDNAVVLEQKFEGGTVGWYSDKEVEAFRTPGTMRDDQTQDDYTTLYNVVKGTSYPKKGKKQN